MVRPGEEVLSEDPSIEVALGRRPIVLDPFMLTRLDRIHPEWVDPLIARIAQRRFGLVVLVVSLDDPQRRLLVDRLPLWSRASPKHFVSRTGSTAWSDAFTSIVQLHDG